MRKIFGGRDVWVGLSNRFRRPFSSTSNPNNNGDKVVVDGSLNQYDAYRDLDKLDFMIASKILFTTPPKQKKFGLDFHLVQLFFACMPSLAVYLVAQYAHYEMRRMEAELEVKKKAEEEAKAKEKEMELKASEEKESGSDAELQEVKARLGKLEEAVKEIVVEGSKKQLGSTIPQKQEDGNGKNNPVQLHQKRAILQMKKRHPREEQRVQVNRREVAQQQLLMRPNRIIRQLKIKVLKEENKKK